MIAGADRGGGADLLGAQLEQAAARALALTSGAALIGLGSGRAASAFVRALAAEVRAGRPVRGVATSGETARLARALGIPVADLDDATLDVTVDGADEVDPRLDLIKGYGGALVRERIVAAASARQIILVGPEKLVPVLGSRGRLPVEVVPFGLPLALGRLGSLAGPPTLRTGPDERPFVSDNGNYIVDCAVGPIGDPAGLAREIRGVPGVVDCGLFVGTADLVLVGEAGGVRELRRGEPARR
jgi:ribose 5-phosphate isomerase A